MIKILFVCHGNICRSPMAEFVMKDLVNKKGMADQFEIASAATSTEEIGNPVYPPAKRKLKEHGISCEGKTARQMTKEDYAYYDYIIAMDGFNLRNMTRFVGNDPDNKVSLLMDFTNHTGDVADPWYTGDFDATWDDVYEGCVGIIKKPVHRFILHIMKTMKHFTKKLLMMLNKPKRRENMDLIWKIIRIGLMRLISHGCLMIR